MTRFLVWLIVASLSLAACDRDDGTVDSTADTVGPVNGLIAYSHDGDIYVGDPATGTSEAIVSGPEVDINPIFSPDGSRIAFIRGKPREPESLIVVRSDGSDERVVVPDGPGIFFAWTPDSASLFVGRGIAGFLYLFDASGVAEPEAVTPPLPAERGAMPFNPSAQVAPMFRPPAGDLVMSGGRDSLQVFDADFTPLRQLDFGHAKYDSLTGFPTWSPDGARILLGVGYYDPFPTVFVDGEMIVMDADGGDLRRLGPGWNPMWSPDSSSIAYEDVGPGSFPGAPDEVRIAVVDLASGAKRVLESSISPVKVGAAVETMTSNEWHTWYYEGWSWSPDGRSLLLLKDHRTRPVVIDVATDTATELPWETDSFPSWQRTVAP